MRDSRRGLMVWTPGVFLGLGALFTVGIDTQRTLPLRASLDSVVPMEIAGYAGRDGRLSENEARLAGVTDYLVRTYERPESPDDEWFSVYVGYYDRQMQGRTIHSPKNCLPGSGWEILGSRMESIETPAGVAPVNRYLLQNGAQQALVVYWYQGRGRVQANEYRVKWDLLRDSALRQRSDEALVRIVVPVHDGDEQAAFATAQGAAGLVVPAVFEALPPL